MARHDNTYSRMVAWLKVLLPVLALMLLSTMFLISRSIDPTRAIPIAGRNFVELVRDQRITEPRYSGVTEDGAAITFSAESARPDLSEPSRFSAESPAARIDTPDGGTVDMTARAALFDGKANTITLSGGVSVVTSTQYSIRSEGLTAALDATRVETEGGVWVQSPMGRFIAGSAALTRQEGEDGLYLLVFKDGVELVYEPKTEGSQ
jgi:lipopolysaccharide export system protein LptC